MTDVVLLFSGGIDSTLVALILKELGHRIHGLSVCFDGRPKKEVSAARMLAQELGFRSYKEIHVKGLKCHSSKKNLSNPMALEGLIPYRNLIYWALAGNRAYSLGARGIAAGHTEEDSQHFNDASEEFFHILRQAMQFGGARGTRTPFLWNPLLTIEEEEWLQLACKNRVLLERTWSCWRNHVEHCESCYACVERREAFVAISSRQLKLESTPGQGGSQ